MIDIIDDPDFKKFAKQVCENMLPHMRDSAYIIAIDPGDGNADVKQAVEIGFAILLGKPLIVLKVPGRVPCEKLLRIADHVIEGDMSTSKGQRLIMKQLNQIMKQ